MVHCRLWLRQATMPLPYCITVSKKLYINTRPITYGILGWLEIQTSSKLASVLANVNYGNELNP